MLHRRNVFKFYFALILRDKDNGLGGRMQRGKGKKFQRLKPVSMASPFLCFCAYGVSGFMFHISGILWLRRFFVESRHCSIVQKNRQSKIVPRKS